MPKHQTRRALSIRTEVYDSLKAYAQKHNVSMSRIVELLVKETINSGLIALVDNSAANSSQVVTWTTGTFDKAPE